VVNAQQKGGREIMALMTWSSAISVNVKQFDEQHKKLIDLINQLHDAMKSGMASALLGDIFQSLISYTATHFADEEKVLKAQGYPDFIKHKSEHEKFVQQVLELQKKYQSGSPMVTVTVMSFLKDWLVKHIQGEDKKYGVFLNKKGIS
jgi:hemerythrin